MLVDVHAVARQVESRSPAIRTAGSHSPHQKARHRPPRRLHQRPRPQRRDRLVQGGLALSLGTETALGALAAITTAISRDEQDRAARAAVLPVGSFEQHGDFLPLITDTVVACLIARRVIAEYGLFLLAPVTLSRSHEHSGFAGTVSVSAPTLVAVVTDVADSLRAAGIDRLAIVNGMMATTCWATWCSRPTSLVPG
jgi:Creatinine amidohydrolase